MVLSAFDTLVDLSGSAEPEAFRILADNFYDELEVLADGDLTNGYVGHSSTFIDISRIIESWDG